MLQGGGTVTMSYSGMGGGNAIIYQAAGGIDPDQRKQHHSGSRYHRIQRLDGGE